MQISELALQKIKDFEGCRLTAYRGGADRRAGIATEPATAGRAGVVRVQHRHRQVQKFDPAEVHPCGTFRGRHQVAVAQVDLRRQSCTYAAWTHQAPRVGINQIF